MFSDLPRRMSYRPASVRHSSYTKPSYNHHYNSITVPKHSHHPINPASNHNYCVNLRRSTSSVLHEYASDSEIDVGVGSTGSIFSLIRSESVSATSAFAGTYSKLASPLNDHRETNDNYSRLSHDHDRSQHHHKSRSGSKSLIPKSCKRFFHKLAMMKSSSRSAVSDHSGLRNPIGNGAIIDKPAAAMPSRAVQVINTDPLPVRQASKGPSIWERRCGQEIAQLPLREPHSR